MCSNSDFVVTITHGSEKHKLQVEAEEDHNEPTLQDMALSVEKVTGVPLASQKLIYKGKSLKEMQQKLSVLGIKNGCKVMLIGKKGFLTKSLQVEALGKLDKRIKTTVEQFMKVLEQIDSMTMPENFCDCKMKRKGLVQKVQGLLAQCDTVEGISAKRWTSFSARILLYQSKGYDEMHYNSREIAL
ncbi:BAG family molecular chaperone regulator 1 isoform X3 [Bufo bufo]|uniref:BAG family molecular chaperone regulator 1 isoform X3 n=1 Tax=Bufo bufo TaxID=8384 RepID=UPI001ABDC137|nr:BAG family molecular chaperone regulator 1 isoform X3 [Bufo bufo]